MAMAMVMDSDVPFLEADEMLDGEGVGRSHMGGGHQERDGSLYRVSELHFIAWLTIQPVVLPSPSGFDVRLFAPSCAKSRTMKQLTLNRVRQGRGARSGLVGQVETRSKQQRERDSGTSMDFHALCHASRVPVHLDGLLVATAPKRAARVCRARSLCCLSA